MQFPVDGILVGPDGGAAVSGASDAMSILNNANIRYAGGAVPQGSSNFFSAITLFNSRPDDHQHQHRRLSGGTGGTEAAIGADIDSFREDDTARGPLIRQVTVSHNSLNGIWLMSESNGFIEPTTAMPYPDQSRRPWAASQNYTFFEPLPFIVLAQLVVGQEFIENTGGQTKFVDEPALHPARRDDEVQQGQRHSTSSTRAASLNVGSRSYINGFDSGQLATARTRPTSSRNRPPTRRSCSPRSSTTRRRRPSCRTRSTSPARPHDTGDARCQRCGAASASRAAPSPSSTRRPSSTAAAAVNTPALHDPLAVGAGVHHR